MRAHTMAHSHKDLNELIQKLDGEGAKMPDDGTPYPGEVQRVPNDDKSSRQSSPAKSKGASELDIVVDR